MNNLLNKSESSTTGEKEVSETSESEEQNDEVSDDEVDEEQDTELETDPGQSTCPRSFTFQKWEKLVLTPSLYKEAKQVYMTKLALSFPKEGGDVTVVIMLHYYSCLWTIVY